MGKELFPFEYLPRELQVNIINFLTPKDLGKLSFICINGGMSYISIGGRLIINGVEYDPSARSTSSEKPSRIDLSIEGKGHIKGTVRFEDCEGTVRCSDAIIIEG